MYFAEPPKLMVDKLEHPLKELAPIVLTSDIKSTLTSELRLLKAYDPMLRK